MARSVFVFKHFEWTSHVLQVHDFSGGYEGVKATLKKFNVTRNDPERSIAAFIAALARSTTPDFDVEMEILTDRKLADYFGLTENYKLFDATRVIDLAGYADEVYLVVLNENEDNIRVQHFGYSYDKPRWFTVKR
jgi:catalase